MRRHIEIAGLMLIPLLAGIILGVSYSYYQITEETSDYGETEVMINETGTFEIDGYKIHLENESTNERFEEKPMVQGYAAVRGDEMWLRTPNSAEYLYEICVHEKMHLLGIPGEDHDWIYDKQDSVVDSTCLRLLAKIEG